LIFLYLVSFSFNLSISALAFFTISSLIPDQASSSCLLISDFKYLRYSVPVGKPIELGDIGVYEDTLCKKKMPIQLITLIDSVYNPKNITDGNMLSHFRGYVRDNSIIFDLSKEIQEYL